MTYEINCFDWSNSNMWSYPYNFSAGNLWSTPTFGSTTSSSTSDTVDENKYMLKSTDPKNPQFLELKQDKIKELKIEETQEALKKTRAQVVDNKKSDGSSSIRTPRKKSGFWSKAGRWLSNGWEAVKNIGKSFVGIEKDGSWNWKKCLKNVAITAAAVGACFIPVVGPAIGYGLIAAGVATGAVGVAKGIHHLNKASDNDDAAIDNAQQEILTGAFVGITSAAGLRGIGRGVSTANASTAAARSSALGKATQGASQFGRDITVNAWRATGEAMKADKVLIAAQTGGKTTSFFKAYGNKVKKSYNSNSAEAAYNKKHQELKTELETKISEIEAKIAAERNASRRALLEQERYMLKQNMEEFNSLGTTIKTKSEYEKLLENNAATDNKGYASSLKSNDILTKTKSVDRLQHFDKVMEQFNKSVEQFQNSYNKKLAELVKAKKREMYSKAGKPDKYKSELNEYVPTRDVEKSVWKPSTWRQNAYQRAIGETRSVNYGNMVEIALTHPASTLPKGFAVFDPIYTIPFGYGEEISSEQYDATLENLDAQIKIYEELEKKINNCKSVKELETLAKAIQNEIGTEQKET